LTLVDMFYGCGTPGPPANLMLL